MLVLRVCNIHVWDSCGMWSTCTLYTRMAGNTGFFLGCNNIEEGAKIIIYGDTHKYTIGPGNKLLKRQR